MRNKELRTLKLESRYLIYGFTSVGITSASATESKIHTSKFEVAGIIDSDICPPISIIKDGKPNYPTRIFVNEDLKVGVFLSYLTLERSLHRVVAKTMLKWAKKHKIRLIVSSVAIKSSDGNEKMMAVGSTDSAREKMKEVGVDVLEHGTVPGIPGMLVNEGSMTERDVLVIIFNIDGK